MKVLLVEDEVELSNSVRDFLESEKFLVEVAFSYDEAYSKIFTYQYDCILLDIMLPGGSGLDLLHKLKESNHETSVLILSAKDSVEDKVSGLELGADDYLAKPFHFAELLARLKSILRRHNNAGAQLITYKDVSINPDSREVYIKDKVVPFNRKEFDVLYYFMLRPTKLLEKVTIAETVWGDSADQSDNLDFIYSQIKNIRKKMKDYNSQVDIQAVYGVGYKIV